MGLFSKKYSSDSDEALMEKVQAQNTAAFEELYTRYSQRLLIYFTRMLGNDGEKAQDFLQELFLKIINKPHLYTQGRKFSAWIFTIAHNMCKNEYRRQSVRKILDYETDTDCINDIKNPNHLFAEYNIDRQLFLDAVNSVLKNCETKQRSTFILRFQEQLSIKEISQILGCSEGTTKSRIFYVTKKLTDALSAFNPNVAASPFHTNGVYNENL